MMQAEPARGALPECPSLADVLLSPGALRTALVKLDGRQLRQAGDCAGTRQRLVTDLASMRRRGTEVIAEGVEAEAEFQLAAHLGIELVQGHHVCRPLSGEFAARVESMFGNGR